MKGNPYLHYAAAWIGLIVGVLGFKLLNVFIPLSALYSFSTGFAFVFVIGGLAFAVTKFVEWVMIN